MPDDPVKPPRFPYVAALLCAACLGAAVWTWMRFSYCWDIVPRDMHCPGKVKTHPLLGRFVRLRGILHSTKGEYASVGDVDPEPGAMHTEVLFARDMASQRGEQVTAKARVRINTYCDGDFQLVEYVLVDATASRLHGASIAGLVVGAMGLFVFPVALRHWLGERRTFREKDEGA